MACTYEEVGQSGRANMSTAGPVDRGLRRWLLKTLTGPLSLYPVT
jgi:hypothetical protein